MRLTYFKRLLRRQTRSYLRRRSNRRFLQMSLIGLGLVFQFQNCGKPLKSSSSVINLSSSAGLTGNETAPIVSLQTVIPALSKSNSLSISFKVAGSSAINSVLCRLDNNVAVNCTSLSATFTNISDGDHKLTIEATDSKGLISQPLITLFRVDSTAPTVSFNQTPAATTGSTAAAFSFSAMDTLSGVSSLQCSLDGAAFSNCVSPLNLSGLSSAAHSFAVKALDAAGNQSANLNYSWTVNTTLPILNITQKPNAIVNLAAASFTFSGTDNGSPLTVYECQVDGAVFAACVSPKSVTVAEGAHTFNVRGKTATGNLSSVSSVSWKTDLTLPSTPVIMSNLISPTTATAINLNFSSTDANGITSYQCALDSAAFSTCTSPAAITVAIGAHTYNVQSTDVAGNKSAVAKYVWTVAAPVSTASSRLIAARAVLTSRCLNCHNGSAAVNFDFATDADFVNTGFVTAGDLSKSKLIYRIQNYPVTVSGARNMPLAGAALSTSDYTILSDWILQMAASSVVLTSTGSGQVKVLRISNYEYKNSLTDALMYQASRQGSTAVASATLALDTINGAISALPADSVTIRLGTDQLAVDSISNDRFTAYVNISYAVASTLTSSSANLKAFAGACATSNTDVSSTSCLDSFITNFGTLLFRTPPKSAEVAELKLGITSWTDLIGRLLVHPRFLTHYEREGTKNADGSFQLTAYELEARLASVFWKSIPDITGLNAASSGTILTSAGLQTEIARLLGSTKAKDNLWKFYQQWLAAARIPSAFDPGAGFTAFASPLAMTDINAANYRDAILQDANDFLSYITWTSKGTLEDLFRSKLIFTMNPTLASVYGITARTSSTQAPITDASGNYAGILSRALITTQKPGGNGVANHVQRGVLILSNILGMELGLPANFGEQQALANQVPVGAGTIEQVRILTSSVNCMGCHSSINPTGFALARYDSLGRYSSVEKRYTVNASGVAVVSATNNVDPTSSVVINGMTYTVSSPATLVDALVSSGVLYQGFTKYFFRFSFGRIENPSYDKSLIDKMIADTKSGSIVNALTNMALHPDFKKARPAQ